MNAEQAHIAALGIFALGIAVSLVMYAGLLRHAKKMIAQAAERI